MSTFSLLEEKMLEREVRLKEDAMLGKGLSSLPPDWNRTREKRIARSKDDFFYFARTYFTDEFNYPFSRHHKQMIADALSMERLIHVYAAPRDFGKTMLFRAFKIWCAVFGKKRFYGKVSDTIDLVINDYRRVRTILKHHPKIIADFGTIISDEWDTMHSFHVPRHRYNTTGTYFSAYSATVTARGELAETRLDFLEFDDFEDFSTSINPDVSVRKIEIIERDFLPALASTGCGVYLGNNARTTCIINLLIELTDTDRYAQHPAFRVHCIDAWDDKNNRPTWHERYTYDSEEAMRSALHMPLSVWNAEMRQKPSPPEGARFAMKDWRSYDRLPDDCRGIIFCDPAFGETSDFKTAVVMLYSPRTKKFYVPECFVRRCGWEQYFLWMYDVYQRWRQCILYIGWESNFAQAQYLQFKSIYDSTKHMPELPIRHIKVEGDKFYRIEQLETPYALGLIAFARDFLSSRDGVEAQSQLIGYVGKKNAQHRVDFPDALSSAYRECWTIAIHTQTHTPVIDFGGRRRSADRWM